MADIRTFLNMGGHAAYVWPALGFAAAVLIGLAVASLRRLRAAEAALAALEPTSLERAP